MKKFILVLLLLTLGYNCAQDRKVFIRNEILKANDFISAKEIRDYKFQAMSVSSFAFFRATNYLYYKDISSDIIAIPDYWKHTPNIVTWLQGDFHIQNVGFFDNQKQLFFDLNDFDDSYMGPFYWDIIRSTASIFLFCQELKSSLKQKQIDQLAFDFLEVYQKSLKEVDGNSKELTATINPKNATGFLKKTFEKLAKKKSVKKLLEKWTTTQNNMRLFNFENPKLAVMPKEELEQIQEGWQGYLDDISVFYQKNPQYFTVKSYAKRLFSGLGSLGCKKYYVLIEGPSLELDDDMLLEVKEQKLPSMCSSKYKFANHAVRAKYAHKVMQPSLDPHTGTLVGKEDSFLVRKISPWKEGYEPKDFEKTKEIDEFLSFTAKALAYAHARADNDRDSKNISYSFEKNALEAIKIWPETKTSLVKLAKQYALQVQLDHKLFAQMVKSGEIK